METIPLADGDLRWVFPDLVDEAEGRDILRQTAECIERLAGHLGVRPSWAGSGLEFHRLPDQRTASRLSLKTLVALVEILDCAMSELIEPVAATGSARPRKAASGGGGNADPGVGSFRPKRARVTRDPS